ncbi:23S rRNA (adenine(2030)-N(6))-methyltransferase RlmJ [Acetobacter musti]|nr:23S rRNA (adenine(2030)-N(6))-methyltransferase RlmJ [Acetobacter musti]
MNYRHAYHAGNFADVMKHALLAALIGALRRKATPFAVLDTHAGIGAYDLSGPQAQATGEWRDGIGRLLDTSPDAPDLAPLQPWLTIVRDTIRAHHGKLVYPGSPELVAKLLRPGDTLTCCELHPEDQRSLRALFRNNHAVSVHARDGYSALTAFLPPRTAKRGLTLMDPPFEQGDEFARLANAIITARTRFPGGIVAAWYPIKHRAPPRAFLNRLKDAGQRNLLTAELTLRPPLDPTRLNGCGLLIANPPWQFEDEARSILGALRPYLAEDETETSVEWAVEWVVPE